MSQYVMFPPSKVGYLEGMLNLILLLGAFSWQSVPHLDLLPTALILIHRLTGLRDGLPHI